MIFTEVIFILTIVSCVLSAPPTYDIFTRIRKDVFENYDKYARPAENIEEVNIINFRLSVNQIEDVDEKSQVITTRAWLKQDWVDTRLTWDPANYSDVDHIIIPFDLIWYPDIVLYNGVDWLWDSYTLPPASLVRIFSDGFVDLGIPVKLRSPCLMNLLNFPFDKQHCHLKFGMWQYNGNESYLSPIDDYVTREDYIENSEWDMVDSLVRTKMQKYPCCIFFYSMLTYTIVLERKPLYYIVNLVVPCFILTVLTLFTFYLPSDSGEKMTLGISILLTLAVYSVIISDSMPPTSTGIPLLHQYVMFSTGLCMISVIMTTIVININHRTAKTHKLRTWVRKFFLEILPPYICLCTREHGRESPKRSDYSRELHEASEGDQNARHQRSNVVHCDDRLCNQSHTLHNVTIIRNANENNSGSLELHPLEHDNEKVDTCKETDSDVWKNKNDTNNKTVNIEHSAILNEIYSRGERIEKHVEDIARYVRSIEHETEVIEDWKLLAAVVDRILFIVLTCACFVGTCVMLFSRGDANDT